MSFGYGHIGALPADRPAWLRPYVLVEGHISSAPLDMPKRFEAVVQRLQAAGWRVVVKSIGTDFGLVPTPRDQPIALYLLRPDRAFTPDEAQAALGAALRELNMAYSPVRAWAAEVTREVIEPTVRQAAGVARTALTSYLLVGGALLVLGRQSAS